MCTVYIIHKVTQITPLPTPQSSSLLCGPMAQSFQHVPLLLSAHFQGICFPLRETRPKKKLLAGAAIVPYLLCLRCTGVGDETHLSFSCIHRRSEDNRLLGCFSAMYYTLHSHKIQRIVFRKLYDLSSSSY